MAVDKRGGSRVEPARSFAARSAIAAVDTRLDSATAGREASAADSGRDADGHALADALGRPVSSAIESRAAYARRHDCGKRRSEIARRWWPWAD